MIHVPDISHLPFPRDDRFTYRPSWTKACDGDWHFWMMILYDLSPTWLIVMNSRLSDGSDEEPEDES